MNEWTDRQYVMLSNVSTEEIFYVSNVDVYLIWWAIARKGNHVFNKMGLQIDSTVWEKDEDKYLSIVKSG